VSCIIQGNTKEQILRATAYAILQAYELARLVNSDSFNPDDRSKLRTLTAQGGGNHVFLLGNELASLCSEKAREIARARQKS
jgi:hypothetical protein